jgi:uncharacterized protein with HEPN domain
MRLDRERLEDMLEAIEAIERHMPAEKQEFDSNELVRVWCLRHIEIIGEAAANISDERRALAPDLPWKQIVGMRNTLIHAYFDVNWRRVWEVVANDLQPLKAGLRTLLGKIESEEG